ncbi:DUF1189 family protein [Thalassobacillus pellis]|uniref:DUF1189 family protein n=1 Tax=Thalassobacillus pellis TaxID=748008 RepID=UPI001961AD87|nr:DUF1189 family protein [Thalassobacillus pellis]MBM7554754.1 hypothetical protein [Thalassobacillus pellis]
MSKTQQMIKCFYHFKMISAFRLKPIGQALGYLFYLSLLLMIPVLTSMILTTLNGPEGTLGEIMKGVSSGVFIIVFTPFIYLATSFLLLCIVSLLAGINLIYGKMTRRRINYKQQWNICCYAITGPTIIFVLLEALSMTTSAFIWLYFPACLVLTLLSTSKVPQ